MNKKILVPSFIVIILCSFLFKTLTNDKPDIEKLRKQHAEYLKNHSFQKTGKLPKKERKAKGLPPNAFFEQKYLSEINPSTGRIHQENIFKTQEDLKSLRKGKNRPGQSSNPWVERGPNNVGGRTRAIIFDPNDTTDETVFAGGVSGGLWKNTNISNPFSKWVQVGIPENLAVSSIAADPNNSKVFYVGTGESYTGGEANGNGLWKSTDGGNSWSKIFGGATSETFFDSNSKITVNTPSNISGDYGSTLSTYFGGFLTSNITGDAVVVNDGTSTTEDACEVLTNTDAIKGKIALIKRGGCNFDDKVLKAQNAGAIAAIIINNVHTTPFNMSGDDTSITIPAIMVSKENGESIITALATNNVNLTLSKTKGDALNSDIVPGLQYINDIAIRNNAGVSEIYIAAGSASERGTSLGGDSFGLYKSVDGTTFSKINIPKTTAGNDYEPNNLEISANKDIYFSTTGSQAFGDGGGAIFKSTDGSVFNLMHTVAKGQRTEIAVSPTNAGVVYILAQISDKDNPVKIFKTTNDFTNVNEFPLPNDADTGIAANDFTRGQAFYDLFIKVDPNDENIIYAGGIDLFKSTNGGAAWNQLSHWYGGFGFQEVHSDQHNMAFASSNRMLFSNDGGVYLSNDAGTNVVSRNANYNTLQFYTVGVAPTTAFDGKEYFIAGAQDNGTQLFANASEGINASVEVQGGDGAASFFDTDGTDKYRISNYVYNGSIRLFNYATNVTTTINSEDGENGDFINQEELDSNKNILYSNYSAASNFIIKRYSNLLSGTIGKDNLTNALMNSSPSAFKVSPFTTSSSKLFTGLQNGKLLVIENADTNAASWSDITGSEFVGSISDIEFGGNESEIFVTMHNYGVKNIWFTKDAGATWKSKEGDFPDIPVKAILQNPLNPKEVIIGTQLGVWKTTNFDADAPNWKQSHNGMSSVPVLDLDLRDDNTVFAATYGRGVFSGKFITDPNADTDGDGIANNIDNCLTTFNPDQKDSDGDGIGDVCQDTDKDGIIDINDNCPTKANTDQKDSDGDGTGDTCQDTDNDTIPDINDNCPTKANTDQKDSNNNGIGDVCDTSYENSNNISLKTISETCVNENDGKISINVSETFVSYTVTLKGGSTNLTEQLTSSSLVFSDLSPATYEVCLKVNDRDYKQCFEVNIDKATPISLKFSKTQHSKEYSFQIDSGTAPFDVFLNGKLLNTFNKSSFNLQVDGNGTLEVASAKPCEGKFKTSLESVLLTKNPVTDFIELKIPTDNSTSQVDAIVFDILGKVVLKQKINKQGNNLSIPFSAYKPGNYILKLGIENTNPIKIIKK